MRQWQALQVHCSPAATVWQTVIFSNSNNVHAFINNNSNDLYNVGLPGWCRSLDSFLSSWNDPTAEAAPAAGSTAPKGVNTAVAAIATLYGDKCKPAHEAASHACQAVEGTRQALTSYMRQGGKSQSGLPVLADLQVAELRMPSNSYRCVALLVVFDATMVEKEHVALVSDTHIRIPRCSRQ